MCERVCVCDLLKQSLLMERFLNICKMISELYRIQQYLFQNNLGVFGVCSGLVSFHCGQSCPAFHSNSTQFKWHDLIKHFFTYNCVQGLRASFVGWLRVS